MAQIVERPSPETAEDFCNRACRGYLLRAADTMIWNEEIQREILALAERLPEYIVRHQPWTSGAPQTMKIER